MSIYRDEFRLGDPGDQQKILSQHLKEHNDCKCNARNYCSKYVCSRGRITRMLPDIIQQKKARAKAKHGGNGEMHSSYNHSISEICLVVYRILNNQP